MMGSGKSTIGNIISKKIDFEFIDTDYEIEKYEKISIKKIFLYHAFYLLQKGLIIGNGIGLSLIALQHFLAPIELDPAHYYVKKLPVALSIEN